MPLRQILLASCHTLWSSVNDDAQTPKCFLQPNLPFHRPRFLTVKSAIGLGAEDNSPSFGLSVGVVKFPLKACKEVVVLIDTAGRHQFALLPVGSWIPDATALGPELMSFGAGKRTGLGRAARAAVLGRIDMAWGGVLARTTKQKRRRAHTRSCTDRSEEGLACFLPVI